MYQNSLALFMDSPEPLLILSLLLWMFFQRLASESSSFLSLSSSLSSSSLEFSSFFLPFFFRICFWRAGGRLFCFLVRAASLGSHSQMSSFSVISVFIDRRGGRRCQTYHSPDFATSSCDGRGARRAQTDQMFNGASVLSDCCHAKRNQTDHF